MDDNAGIRRALEILLPTHFAEVKTIPSPATLVSSLEQFRPDVEVVLFTAYADIALAVEGMKRGAFDFIVKPWDNEKLVATLTAARDKARKAMKCPVGAGHDGRKPDVLGLFQADGSHP